MSGAPFSFGKNTGSARSGGVFYDRAALLGTGLMGGSLGVRLRERRLVREIVGYDRDRSALHLAVERGAVDEIAAGPREAVRGAGLVILAVPVLSMATLVGRIRDSLDPETVLTDLGSTKARVLAGVIPLLPSRVHFIGGHPMAGSEEVGIGAADPALLENAVYVLSPAPEVPDDVVKRLAGLVEAAGAQPLIMDPQTHDRITALVSHLPHLIAAALVSVAAGAGEEELIRTLAAGGFRDSTRVALGNPVMWRDICLTNREALQEALRHFAAVLDRLREVMAFPGDHGRGDTLEGFFQKARDFRRLVPHRGRGILPELFEIAVLVADNPGVIGRLATLLGENGINIASIEILHVRELEGGSLRIGFRDAAGREAALTLLRARGYRAHSRG